LAGKCPEGPKGGMESRRWTQSQVDLKSGGTQTSTVTTVLAGNCPGGWTQRSQGGTESEGGHKSKGWALKVPGIQIAKVQRFRCEVQRSRVESRKGMHKEPKGWTQRGPWTRPRWVRDVGLPGRHGD